jgi:hypothetical protein
MLRPKTIEEIARTKLRILQNKALKYDSEKPRLELLPARPLIEIAKVLTQGAQKYADYDWEKGVEWGRTYGSIQRHLLSWHAGEDLDPESNLSHLAHAACQLLFLIEFLETHRELDNRPSSQALRSVPPSPVAPEPPAGTVRYPGPDPDY